MNSLPFKINFFKQIEIFQNIERLDRQFNEMLVGWKKGAFKKSGLSQNIQINYPTWEIEKKILLWTAQHHKHLGSPITTRYCSNPEFQKDVHASETELSFAGKEEVLKNLVARKLATWNKGAVISEKGLDYGLLISTLYKINPDESIKNGKTRFREETLVKKKINSIGFKLLYFSALTTIIASLIIICSTVFRNLTDLFFSTLTCNVFKYLIICLIFAPLILFLGGIFLTRNK